MSSLMENCCSGFALIAHPPSIPTNSYMREIISFANKVETEVMRPAYDFNAYLLCRVAKRRGKKYPVVDRNDFNSHSERERPGAASSTVAKKWTARRLLPISFHFRPRWRNKRRNAALCYRRGRHGNCTFCHNNRRHEGQFAGRAHDDQRSFPAAPRRWRMLRKRAWFTGEVSEKGNASQREREWERARRVRVGKESVTRTRDVI